MPRNSLGNAVAPVCLFLLAQVLPGVLDAQVRPRITRRVDTSAVVRIPGTTHPAVAAATLVGRAPAALPMERMLLHLSSSPEQQAALEQLLADQQDPASPRYQQWLTPEQFGEQFGPAQQDIDAITGWLQSQGFQVTEIAAGRRSIEFRGTARQVEGAFRTQIDHYQWNGQRHTANANDISIPEALAPVVAGIASLHDFGPRPLYHTIPAPLTNFSGGTHGLSPYDFAAIYNVASLWNAGYDGSGQKIAVVGESSKALLEASTYIRLGTYRQPVAIGQPRTPKIGIDGLSVRLRMFLHYGNV